MPILAEVFRNQILESVHHGHAVVMHADGDVLLEIGDPERVIFPRSSCKMLQALPLLESGAAREYDLTSEHLALACASHNGEAMHVERVGRWLEDLSLGDGDLRCGPQPPARKSDQFVLHDHGKTPMRAHNNCSGKHAGFLTLNKKLGGGSEYHEVDHPVQKAVRAAFEELTEEASTGHGVDGCGAPNFTTTMRGLARAAASFARGADHGGVRGEAMERLIEAMMAHPLLVAGTNRACSALISAAAGKAVVKTGAEAVYVGILPSRQIGIAIKVDDGNMRGSECAIAALLVRLGAVDASDPRVKQFLFKDVTNYSDQIVGQIRPSAEIWQGGALF